MFRLYCPAVDYDNTIINGYIISSDGIVRSLDRYKKGKNDSLVPVRGKIISPFTKKGTQYQRASLSINGKPKKYYVHALVALAFPGICGEYFEGACLDHKNGIQNDNRADNLWWCTFKENIYNPNTFSKKIDASIKNLKCITKESVERAKLKKYKPVICNETGEHFISRFAAAKKYNVNPMSVWKCCSGMQKKTKNGYSFSFV